jgi:hypothetical protein
MFSSCSNCSKLHPSVIRSRWTARHTIAFCKVVWSFAIIKMNLNLEPIHWFLCPLPKSFKGCFRPGDEEDATAILVNLTVELWSGCELWSFKFPIRVSARASRQIFWDIGLTFVPAFNLSLFIGIDIFVEDSLIRIKYKPLSWRS